MPTTLLALYAALAAPGVPVFVAAHPGDPVAGPLLRFGPEDTALLATPGGPATVTGVVSLRLVGRPRPPLPRGPLLATVTGDRLPGTVAGGDRNTLRFRPDLAGTHADAPEWTVPLAAVAVVRLARPPADAPDDPARDPIRDGLRRDALRFRNGDTLLGTFDAFTTDAVRVRPDGQQQPRVVPLDQLAAVALNPALARGRKPKSAYAHVVLADGTRIDITAPAAADGRLTGKTLFGAAVSLPLDRVVALDVVQGGAVYLSDLTPTKTELTPFLSVAWPPAVDQSAKERPLRVATPHGPSTHDKGLGTHPTAALTYDLGGTFRRFDALVGLDPDGDRGRADVRILVDGREQDLPALRGLTAAAAVPVRVDVTGAKELTLVVRPGPAGDVAADVNWADARLIP